MTDASPPDDDLVIYTHGPYTLRCCITAACTGCGTAPLDEDSGIAPHFDSARQAAEELIRDWGWRLTTRNSHAGDLELLCPACAKGDDSHPQAPAASDGTGRVPGAPPQDGEPGVAPMPWLPPNTRVPPAADRTREGR